MKFIEMLIRLLFSSASFSAQLTTSMTIWLSKLAASKAKTIDFQVKDFAYKMVPPQLRLLVYNRSKYTYQFIYLSI